MATVEQGPEQRPEPAGSEDEGNGGRVDGVALLYIAGGIPVMVVFFVLLFVGAHACDIPA